MHKLIAKDRCAHFVSIIKYNPKEINIGVAKMLPTILFQFFISQLKFTCFESVTPCNQLVTVCLRLIIPLP